MFRILFPLCFPFSAKYCWLTYVKCDFVCRCSTQSQVHLCFDATCTSHRFNFSLLFKLVGISKCPIKCLEPHAIYCKENVCAQTNWNRQSAMHTNSHTNMFDAGCLNRSNSGERQCLPRSYYQHVYFHLHLHFFACFYLVLSCQHLWMLNIGISWRELPMRRLVPYDCTLPVSRFVYLTLIFKFFFTVSPALVCINIVYLFCIWYFSCSFPFSCVHCNWMNGWMNERMNGRMKANHPSERVPYTQHSELNLYFPLTKIIFVFVCFLFWLWCATT